MSLRDAVQRGQQGALTRFQVREASALEAILGAVGAGLGGSVARGAIGAVSPRLLPALENVGALPVNALRRVFSGPSSPAELLVKQLNNAQLPPLSALRTPIR